MSNIQVGSRVEYDGSRGFNHGCRDWASLDVLAVNGNDSIDVVVIETSTCHSCWQVGHDRNHTHEFSVVGDVFQLTRDEYELKWDEWYQEDRLYVA